MLDKLFLFIKIFLILLLCASPSYAGSSLAWDPPDTGTVNGYRIYYGYASGNYPDKVDVGNVTQYELSNLSLKDNTEYFFVVRAYNDAGESGDSNEISWKSGDSTPPLTPQGLNLENAQEGVKLLWTANTESDLNAYNVCYSTISRQYGSFIPAGKVTSYTIPFSYLDAGKTYYFAVKAIDTAGNESGPSAEVSTSIALPDTTAPQVSIASPFISRTTTYKIYESSISLSGSASDNKEVIKVTWTSSTGGSGTAAGTANWSISNIALQEGINEIIVTAEDAAGNKGRQSLNLTYIVPDTIDPVVAFVSPTASASYSSDKNTINISGTASDNVGIAKVTWSISGGVSGIATGTENWSVSNISLSEGMNEIIVTAEDSNGNIAEKKLAVTYSISDAVKPAISITSPKSRGRSIKKTKKQYLDISGTASDNKGVVQVIWESSSGTNGTASGTDEWSVSSIELVEGKNIITITAVDAAGNNASQNFAIIYSP